MQFPVEFNLAGQRVPAHGVLELAAYVAGVQLYFYLRRRTKLGVGAALPVDQNLWLIVGCVLGAMVGSKILAWLESPWDYWSHRSTPLVLLMCGPRKNARGGNPPPHQFSVGRSM